MSAAQAKWTVQYVPDLSGRSYVVTGGNSGIGFEAARVLAHNGARVILACRSLHKAAEAAEVLGREARGSGQVETVELDLMRLTSVRACARALRERAPRLDGLVNNAGIMMTPYERTEDGFEGQLGTNHFGHFALTGLLLPSLLAAPEARVVTVSSLAHANGRMDWENLHNEGGRGYDRRRAYGRSKLANLLFMRGLQVRFERHGLRAASLAAHPGLAQTNLFGHLLPDQPFVRALTRPLTRGFLQPAAMGALPTLRALTDPAAQGGEYYGPDGFRQFWGYPTTVGSTRASRDPSDIERLWAESERLTGVVYPWPGSDAEKTRRAQAEG